MAKYIRPSDEYEENDKAEDDYWGVGKKKKKKDDFESECSVWLRGNKNG